MSIKYNKYLSSNWWKSLRSRRLSSNNRCEICGNRNYLQIHHYNYEHKYAGDPKKAIKHTKVLCNSCHKAFHDTHGVKKDMTAEMKFFESRVREDIKMARQMREELEEKELWIARL